MSRPRYPTLWVPPGREEGRSAETTDVKKRMLRRSRSRSRRCDHSAVSPFQRTPGAQEHTLPVPQGGTHGWEEIRTSNITFHPTFRSWQLRFQIAPSTRMAGFGVCRTPRLLFDCTSAGPSLLNSGLMLLLSPALDAPHLTVFTLPPRDPVVLISVTDSCLSRPSAGACSDSPTEQCPHQLFNAAAGSCCSDAL